MCHAKGPSTFSYSPSLLVSIFRFYPLPSLSAPNCAMLCDSCLGGSVPRWNVYAPLPRVVQLVTSSPPPLLLLLLFLLLLSYLFFVIFFFYFVPFSFVFVGFYCCCSCYLRIYYCGTYIAAAVAPAITATGKRREEGGVDKRGRVACRITMAVVATLEEEGRRRRTRLYVLITR